MNDSNHEISTLSNKLNSSDLEKATINQEKRIEKIKHKKKRKKHYFNQADSSIIEEEKLTKNLISKFHALSSSGKKQKDIILSTYDETLFHQIGPYISIFNSDYKFNFCLQSQNKFSNQYKVKLNQTPYNTVFDSFISTKTQLVTPLPTNNLIMPSVFNDNSNNPNVQNKQTYISLLDISRLRQNSMIKTNPSPQSFNRVKINVSVPPVSDVIINVKQYLATKLYNRFGNVSYDFSNPNLSSKSIPDITLAQLKSNLVTQKITTSDKNLENTNQPKCPWICSFCQLPTFYNLLLGELFGPITVITDINRLLDNDDEILKLIDTNSIFKNGENVERQQNTSNTLGNSGDIPASPLRKSRRINTTGSLDHDNSHLTNAFSNHRLNNVANANLQNSLKQSTSPTSFDAQNKNSLQTKPLLLRFYFHTPCLLWASHLRITSVGYENLDKCVTSAFFRKCSICSKIGANINCCGKNCSSWFHFSCAAHLKDEYTFEEASFLALCPLHKNTRGSSFKRAINTNSEGR